MTITYHAGSRLQGLSTDLVLDTPTLSDDFSSSTGWTTVGTGVNVNSTYAGALAIKAIGNANNTVYKTITTIPYNQNFQATFKFRITSMAQDLYTYLCTFASTQGDPAVGTGADLVGVAIRTLNGHLTLIAKDQATVRSIADGATLSTGTDYWAKYVYSAGTSHSVTIYSDSAFTNQVATLSQNISGMNNNFTIFEAGMGNEGGTVTNFDGYIDDLKIYSTPKPTNVPTNSRFEETDTRKIYYLNAPNLNDDFTSYATQGAADAAWVTNNTTYIRADITNDYLGYSGIYNRSSTLYAASHDMGAGNVSDTAWVLRFKFANTTVNNDGAMWVGIRSIQNGLTTATSDSLGVLIYAASPNASNWGFSSFSSDNAGLSIGTQYDTGVNYSNNKTMWVEIIRQSSTSMKITLYSDSSYSTVLYTQTVSIASTITGLRYITFQNSNHGTGATSYQITGNIDDVKFWNSVTSVSPNSAGAIWSQVN